MTGEMMTKRQMYWKMILAALLRRRSRMLTALFSVALGATILSGLVTIYYDIPRQMGREFRSYGANLVLAPGGGKSEFGISALENIRRLIPPEAVTGIAPYRYEVAKINQQPFMVAGTDFAEVKKTSPWWDISGRWPEKPGEVLAGAEAAKTVGLSEGAVFVLMGRTTEGTEYRKEFTLTGILETGGKEEGFLFLRLPDLEDCVGDRDKINAAELSLSLSRAQLEATADRIADAGNGVVPRTVRRVAQSEGAVLGKLRALVYLVTAVTLVLTMVCVLTTMMAAVVERRKEIGLKKALGADNRTIVREFLGEGLVLGALGGMCGVFLGFLFAQVISRQVFHRGITLTLALIPATILTSLLITALACLIPVRNAAQVDPAVVLRGE